METGQSIPGTSGINVEALEGIKVIDFGLTAIVLLVVYKALAVVGHLYVAKKTATDFSRKEERFCQLLKEVHEATMDTEKQKQQGNFRCQFKDRDEVRDLIDSMKHVVVALNELTAELRRSRRNGGSP